MLRVWAFSCCGESYSPSSCSSDVVLGLLIAVASLVAEH